MANKDMTMWSGIILLVIGLIWLIQVLGVVNLVTNGIWLPLLAILYGLKKVIYK